MTLHFALDVDYPMQRFYFPELLKESLENEYGGFKDPKTLSILFIPLKVAF